MIHYSDQYGLKDKKNGANKVNRKSFRVSEELKDKWGTSSEKNKMTPFMS
jgi:hypothetical protein